MVSFLATHDKDYQQSQIIVRNAEKKDIPQLTDTIVDSFYQFPQIFQWIYPLFKLSISEDLRYRLKYKPRLYSCLVATLPNNLNLANKETIIGTVEISVRENWWSIENKYPYICNLAVKKGYRRQGIGCQLLTKCEQIARDWGYQEICLHVLQSNTVAKQLYFRMGYQVIREEFVFNGFFPQNSCRLLLRKQL